MKPPSVYELTTPSSHSTSSNTKIVHNISILLALWLSRVDARSESGAGDL